MLSAGLGDVLRNLFDFESWAPRSSQAWRLGQQPAPRRGAPDSPINEDSVEILNQRLAANRQTASPPLVSDTSDVQPSHEENSQDSPSFLQSSDDEFAEALNARISEVASSLASCDGNTEEAGQLSGTLLADLIYAKYGKKHDVSFVRRDIPGKTLVSLNIYHAYLGQRSFPMTEESWLEKLDGIALYLEAWNQADAVISFLKEPVAPRRGLPSRPIVGNAVSVQLDLSRDQISEWFGR